LIPLDKKIILDIKSLEDLLPGLAHPIVFTNGCFDILHRGHVDYIKQAAELGKTLIIGLNTDESIRKLNKGDDRPINSFADRAEILAALEKVDIVVPFDTETPIELIEIISPDVLVKGGDWPVKDIVGYDFVTSAGGMVKAIPFRFQRSTTALLNKIRHGK
jgi:rfaE bifunctional protein nucleotidyltransferase chain/domain